MRYKTCVYLCNAIDETVRAERRIVSDSPAATQKVLGVSEALESAGIRTIVLSLGRGRQNGSWKYSPSKVVKIGRVIVVYAPFLHFPVLTHFVSLVGLVPLIYRLRRRAEPAILLAYNRLPHYVLAVILARITDYICFLDLEDGDVGRAAPPLTRLSRWAARKFFDEMCSAGTVLAAKALGNQSKSAHITCCYGVARTEDKIKDWQTEKVTILFGGTLQQTTGAQLFINTIERLRANSSLCGNIEFWVTGKGAMASQLVQLASNDVAPHVRFFGEVSRSRYLELLSVAQVGLSLKLPSSELADTTFPSKVIEFAEHGLLVLSTRVSDVPELFCKDGALFLQEESPEDLAAKLIWIAEHRQQAKEMALRGQQRIVATCSPQQVGGQLAKFLFDESAAH